jgi:hypothetical protein
MSRLYPLIGSLSLVLLFSCVDYSEYEVDSIETNPTIALPVVTGRFTLNDLLDKADPSIVKVYPDGLIYFAYSKEMESQAVGDMFSVPEISSNTSFSLPGGVLPATTQDMKVDSITKTIDFAMDPMKIDEIGILLGNLAFTTTSSSPVLDYEVRLSIPGLKSSAQVPLNATMRGTGSLNLNSYTIAMDDNKIQVKVVLILKRRPSPVVIPPGTTINAQLSFQNFDFRHLRGFLGEQTAGLPETGVEMGAFGDLFGGAVISLAQPKVTLTITNEYGIPCTADFPILEGRKEGAPPLPIILNPPGPISIQHPTVMGASAQTTVSFTNIGELLAYAPTSLHFQASAAVNGGLTTGENFVIDTSAIKMKLDIEVPMYGHATGITIQDTLDIDLSETDDSQIAKAALKLKISNQLPLDGTVQFILLDNTYKVLDVLLTDAQKTILRGSKVNASGDLVTPGLYDQMIEITKEKAEKVFDARHIIVVLSFQTSRDASGNAQNVKFKADYGVDLQAGILVDLKLKVQ